MTEKQKKGATQKDCDARIDLLGHGQQGFQSSFHSSLAGQTACGLGSGMFGDNASAGIASLGATGRGRGRGGRGGRAGNGRGQGSLPGTGETGETGEADDQTGCTGGADGKKVKDLVAYKNKLVLKLTDVADDFLLKFAADKTTIADTEKLIETLTAEDKPKYSNMVTVMHARRDAYCSTLEAKSQEEVRGRYAHRGIGRLTF